MCAGLSASLGLAAAAVSGANLAGCQVVKATPSPHTSLLLASHKHLCCLPCSAESGGICSFCGKHVELRYADGSTNAADIAAAGAAAGLPGVGALAEGREMPGPTGARPTGQQQQGGKGGAAGPAALAYNESAAEAVALRDRLVQFDREAAKRTTVLDDQSDFFEIDANAWLTGVCCVEESLGCPWQASRLTACTAVHPAVQRPCTHLAETPLTPRPPNPHALCLDQAVTLLLPGPQTRRGRC
jgi:hypothetical protein